MFKRISRKLNIKGDARRQYIKKSGHVNLRRPWLSEGSTAKGVNE
jgi:hypothetical protein